MKTWGPVLVALVASQALGSRASAQAFPSPLAVPEPPPTAASAESNGPPPPAAGHATPPAAAAVPASQPTAASSGAEPASNAWPPALQRYPRDEYRYTRPARRPMALMIVGVSVFGGFYVPPAVLGALYPAEIHDCRCNEAYRLLIPIAGPLTLIRARNEPGSNVLLVVDSVGQVAGAVLATLGILRFVAGGSNDSAASTVPKLALSAAPLPGGGYAALRLRL